LLIICPEQFFDPNLRGCSPEKFGKYRGIWKNLFSGKNGEISGNILGEISKKYGKIGKI
jgi:hypothetical protein